MSGSIWKRELSLGRRKQVEAAVEPAHDAAEPVTSSEVARIDAYLPDATEAAPLPPTTGDYGWLTENFDPNDIPAEMPAVSAPPVSVPEPARPAAVTPAPAPVPELVAAEPVPAEPAEKKPFWKQELTLKRQSKEPKQRKQPKAKK